MKRRGQKAMASATAIEFLHFEERFVPCNRIAKLSSFLSSTFPVLVGKWFIFHTHSRIFPRLFFKLFIFINIPGYPFIFTAIFLLFDSLQ